MNFFFSSRRRHTRWTGDWSSDVCSSDLGKPGELALVAQLGEPAQRGREAVGLPDRVGGELLQQKAVVAEMAGEGALFERAHAVADIVADAVGGEHQRVAPVGEEQRRQRMRLVVIGEMIAGVGAKAVVDEESLAGEDLRRIGGAPTLAL